MVVPSRREAARLLLELDPPDWLLRHSAVVAEVAAFLGAAIGARGHRLDHQLVESAALLHDLDKALPRDDPRLRLGHGHAGAAWLGERGFDELSHAVAGHPVMRLADDGFWSEWEDSAPLESRVVAYADKRATDTLVSMAERFAGWRARYPESAAATDRAEQRAAELERRLCAAAGLQPDAVGRLAWAEQALGLQEGAA